MIPLALTVRNFLSYGSAAQTLDFAGIRLLCLSGENGHGKSALLDAMTWVLFGRARAATDDELLHHGATEMHVVFDMELNGLHYRLSRLRTQKGKTRQTQLEVLVAEPDGAWRTLTGNSVRETERLLEQLLGMNYQTFVNSAFLLQGRADEFTVKSPAERKKILADLLNLEAYERLAERAKARREHWKVQIESIELDLKELQRRLERLGEAREAVERARAKQGAADAALPPAAERLATLRAAWERLQQVRQDAVRLREEHERLLATVRQQQQAAADLRATLDRACGILAGRDRVERDFACWRERRAVEQQYAARLVQLQPLRDQERKLLATIDAEESRLRQDLAKLDGKLLGCLQQTTAGKEAESLLDGVLAELAPLADVEERRGENERRRAELREAVAGLKATNEALDRTVQQLRSRYQTLGNGDAPCPTCQQALSTQQRERLRAEMKAEAEDCKAQLQANLVAIDGREKALRALEKAATAIGAEMQRRQELQRREGVLRQKVHDAQCARTQLASWEQERAAVLLRLERADFAADARRELERARAAIADVGYDEGAHRAATRDVAALSDVEERKRTLDEAAQVRASAGERLAQVEATLAAWGELQHHQEARLAAIDRELLGAGVADQDLRAQQALVQRLQEEQREAVASVATAEGDLARLEEDQEHHGRRLATLREARAQHAVYVELTDSFGRNGVQAMLIDEAIPQIEEEANRLLAAMTDGRLTVSLETQRLTQKLATVETLDVKIGDELGTRNYELYSGGEAFRVNFALRVALSRLLAHRAGTRLQTLVIDEGFGSQDATGRERLQSALASVADDFACIVVITHLDDLKDAFPNRIEVVKDADGSHLRVVA